MIVGSANAQGVRTLPSRLCPRRGARDDELRPDNGRHQPRRGHSAAVMRQWLDLVASHVPFAPKLIVDVGCGTGRVFEPLAERFAAKVIGIDPSPRMLSVARTKYSSGRGEFRLAPAEKLPLADGCADLVFMSMVPTTSWTRKPPHARAIAYCDRFLRLRATSVIALFRQMHGSVLSQIKAGRDGGWQKPD
jgi:ubiquinone/menaquinone biosynthesis C-methylase UbiE